MMCAFSSESFSAVIHITFCVGCIEFFRFDFKLAILQVEITQVRRLNILLDFILCHGVRSSRTCRLCARISWNYARFRTFSEIMLKRSSEIASPF